MTLREKVLKAASTGIRWDDKGKKITTAKVDFSLIEALAECAEILEMLRPLYLDMDELCDDVEAALAKLEALLKDVK